MATLVSVIVMVLTGQTLKPPDVFMLLCFMRILKNSCFYDLPVGFMGTYDAFVSLGRIEEFLLLNDMSETSFGDECKEDRLQTESGLTRPNICFSDSQAENMSRDSSYFAYHEKDPIPTTVCVSNLTCKQYLREDEFILQDIDIVVPPQSLTVITGPVGSGKSTLLSAIAGEIPYASGTIKYQGSVVYLPQSAWVFSGTIRENILFGQPYEEFKYERIVEACALKEDIQRFPDGDLTIVGERGEVLSGGQQARISLARAVYADGDLYLLDDPLSAVDFKVGQHIFEKCMKDLLGNKVVLLSSHHQQHMKNAGQVIVLNKGRVLEKGRFTELQEQGIISSIVDSHFKASMKNNTEPYETVGLETKEKHDDINKCQEILPLPNAGKSLEIAPEDRTIGVVTSKLYWDYFTSGVHPLTIIGMGVLFLISEGKLAPRLSICSELDPKH